VAINVNITKSAPEETPVEEPKNVTVNVKKTAVTLTVPSGIKIDTTLQLYSSLNGDLMIMDHRDIDIVISQEDNKITCFPKEMTSDMTYGASSRLFDFLRKRGIIEFDSVQGGNVYGSFEAKMQTSEQNADIALMCISGWMKEEAPYMDNLEDFDEDFEKHMLNPDGEYSTELGEVPHDSDKGSIKQRNLFAPYLYGRYTYE
jgi:hypothetical protein